MYFQPLQLQRTGICFLCSACAYVYLLGSVTVSLPAVFLSPKQGSYAPYNYSNNNADRKTQHGVKYPTYFPVPIHIQHINRIHVIALRHLVQHPALFGSRITDIACRIMICPRQYQIVVKIYAKPGTVCLSLDILMGSLLYPSNVSHKPRS